MKSQETHQPNELKELKSVATEFLRKLEAIDNEMLVLKEDRKSLIDEYSKKLDMKTFKAALQVDKIKKNVDHKDTFDTFLTILES